jgi:hypothetical protein
MEYTEGRKKPDLQGPFTKQNIHSTLQAASEELGGTLQYAAPSRRNILVCEYCKAKEPQKMTGNCCVAYAANPKTRRGKSSTANGEQAVIKNLVIREEDRSGMSQFFGGATYADQAGSMCPR